MTSPAAAVPEPNLPPRPLALPRVGRAPMFGHCPVTLGQHAGAVFGAAFVNSLVQVLIGSVVAASAVSLTGGTLGPQPLTTLSVGGFVLWTSLFPVVLGQLGLFFTVGWGLLGVAKRNFGAAYLAIGLAGGMVEASVVGLLRGTPAPRDFIFAAATGIMSGFIYWLIASRGRSTATPKEQAGTSAVFS